MLDQRDGWLSEEVGKKKNRRECNSSSRAFHNGRWWKPEIPVFMCIQLELFAQPGGEEEYYEVYSLIHVALFKNK